MVLNFSYITGSFVSASFDGVKTLTLFGQELSGSDQISMSVDLSALTGSGGGGGGSDPLLTALRMQRYAQAGKYISSVRVPEKPGTPPVTKMPKTESYLTYNKFWDEKLLSYYKLARTVAK